jgi:hypothetical protein
MIRMIPVTLSHEGKVSQLYAAPEARCEGRCENMAATASVMMIVTR